MTDVVNGPTTDQIIKDMVADIKSLAGFTESGFHFELLLGNLFFLAAFLSFLAGLGTIAEGISLGDLFIKYDIGIYYLYTSIILFGSGRVVRSQIKS